MAAGKRNNGKQEHENAHSADPVGKAAPEKRCLGKGFNICQNTCSCGCETARRFKNSVNITRYLAGKAERNSSAQAENNPGECNRNKALFGVKDVLFRLSERKQQTQNKGNRGNERIDLPLLFAVKQSYGNGQEQTAGLNEKNQAQQIKNHKTVHNTLPYNIL